MNTYEITFDATIIIAISKNKESLFLLLYESDNRFHLDRNKNLYYQWEKDIEICKVNIVDQQKEQVVHWVSH